MKYQFCIRFENTTVNSAATKAVQDCNRLFSEKGYIDYTFTVWDNKNKKKYYLQLAKELFLFFVSIKRKSIVGIQYPLLSINNVFGKFIKLAKLKGVKFFCIIHDVESLRVGGNNEELNKIETNNLNYFDSVIVHNENMLQWLRGKGFKKNAVSLEIFDYLCPPVEITPSTGLFKKIVFAGNLNKSTFIYSLSKITGWSFNIYGPNFNPEKNQNNQNVNWFGEFSPEQLPSKLVGNFGLIWDGESIDKCDEFLGNYLKYNNPHKFSLYIAAGLPIIAPADSAISVLINEHKIGLLINDLRDLDTININDTQYNEMKNNILKIREKVIRGDYFKSAIYTVENELSLNL